MNKVRILFLLLCSFLFLTSCNHDEEKKEQVKKRVVMFYIVSENSLLGFDTRDIDELLASKSLLHDDEEVVIYLDNDKFPAIYSITNKTVGERLSQITPEYEYATDQNSSSGVALSEFIGYVKSKHKAQSYGIVLWSHGTGWIPSDSSIDSQTFSKKRSFGIDNGNNTNKDSGNKMAITELHGALKSLGMKFDFIFFDCCFMQSIEVAYELRDVTKYIIASPAEIPGPGADYEVMLPQFFANSNYQITIPNAYYTSYKEGVKGDPENTYGVLISSIDCSQLENFAAVTSDIVAKHRDELLNMDYREVQNYFIYYNCRHKAMLPDFYDMNGIMMKLLPEDEYRKWKTSFDSAVIYANTSGFWVTSYPYTMTRYVDRSQFGGVSMYVPLEKYSNNFFYASSNEFFVHGYYASQWAKVLGWDGSYKAN